MGTQKHEFLFVVVDFPRGGKSLEHEAVAGKVTAQCVPFTNVEV